MHKENTGERDSDIIRSILAGDVNAFEVLIERHRAHVFAIVRRHIPNARSDEVAHDVFIKAYQGLPGLIEKNGFKQWLSGIAVRTCYDFWRKEYNNPEVPMSQLNDTELLERSVSECADRAFDDNGRIEDAREMLERALNSLSAANRMVINLVYLEGHTHKEAASLLGWSVANIKIRAHRARKLLHKTLIQEMGKNTEAHEEDHENDRYIHGLVE